SKGKDIRAQPISALYEQGRVIHCNNSFAYAEDQMCAFVDSDDNEGADMVDAIVWAITELAELDIQISGEAISIGSNGTISAGLTNPSESTIIAPASRTDFYYPQVIMPGQNFRNLPNNGFIY